MPSFKTRSYEPEIMDDFSIADQGLRQTLKELDVINHLLGGNRITFSGLNKLLPLVKSEDRPISIVDLGCGSGEMLRLIYHWAKKKGLKVDLVGIDANPAVIAYAREKSQNFPDIHFEIADIFSENFANSHYDIVLCTLFLHHFDEDTLKGLFRQLKRQTSTGIVINDLHRHWLAYYAIKWLTSIFSKSYMTKYDAKLSVRRGFLKHELLSCFFGQNWFVRTFKWAWAFRWQVVLSHD